jgi:hypothetical protein
MSSKGSRIAFPLMHADIPLMTISQLIDARFDPDNDHGSRVTQQATPVNARHVPVDERFDPDEDRGHSA